MNKSATKRNALMLLFAVLLAVCVALALSLTFLTEKAVAQADETPAERTPAVTYVIGDGTVTDESGFTFDEASDTYTYHDHMKGWTAALAKSAELHNAEEADANLVKVQLASTWNISTSILFRNANVLLDLNGFDIDRGLTSAASDGYVFSIQNGLLEITDTSSGDCGKITGGYLQNANGAGILLTGSNTTVTLSNGSITGNVASNGGAVRVNNGSTFIMNGGSVTRNSAGNGGGIFVSGATSKAIINGGTISGNFSSGQGAGVYVQGGILELNGGTITNNGSRSVGAGVFLQANVSNNVSLSGKICIKDNYQSKTFTTSTDNYDSGTRNDFYFYNQPVAVKVNKMQAGADVSFILPNATDIFTTGYADSNADANGVVADPAQFFTADSAGQKIVLNAEGELQMTNQGIPEWTVTSTDSTKIENSAYGSVITYSENTVTGISLTQNGTDIADIAIKDSNNSDATLPLTNAGTYYATATVKGIGSATLQTKFTIVILPYNIEGKTTYTLTASGWTEDNGNYTDTYNGSAKATPSLAVQLNGASFADTNYTITYSLNETDIDALKEVGEYTLAIVGTGNYCGTVALTEKFTISPDLTKSYTVTWQYYNGETWQTISDAAPFTYTSADYSRLVRTVLTVADLETRYVYADGVTEYNLASGEGADDVTHALTLGIAKNSETAIVNAGEYELSLIGTPNYSVAEADRTSSVSVAKYDLSEITEVSTDTAMINAALDGTVYNSEDKTLTLSVGVTLGGNEVVLGASGAEYELAVKYVNEDESETAVEKFILGGTYKIYITATGGNFTGTLGIVPEIVINKADNAVTLNSAGGWEFGKYNTELHGIASNAAFLYDGTIAGTQQTYVYYTVNSASGNAVNDTLTRFTSLSDEVISALNALDKGDYTLKAEIDETASYTGATAERAFVVLQAVNAWVSGSDDVVLPGWVQGKFNPSTNLMAVNAAYGDSVIEVRDINGKVYYNSLNPEENTLNDLKAGKYLLVAWVNGTDNYSALAERTFTIEVMDRVGMPGWVTAVIVVGALVLVAAVILILWKTGVFQIMTEKAVVAIRTRANADAVIASARAAKRMEEGKATAEEAKRKERIEQLRQKAAEQRALPPEQRAAQLEERAQAEAEKAEKIRIRSEKLQARADKMRNRAAVDEEVAASDDTTETEE